MLHILCSFLLLEVYFCISYKTSIDTRIVQSFRLGFFLYIMSRDQFFIFRFVHEVEVFGRLPKPLSSSCLTNRVLFSRPWVQISIFVYLCFFEELGMLSFT